ncbi:MAG: hypothetical protein KUG79_01515 [Pseudomonadales bacterium]|nr:hypothetical protein [Pseudomonadales bacterium]
MPTHNFKLLQGRIEYINIHSKAISNNMLGDPTCRQVAVYLPAGYDDDTEHYPLLVDLAAFTSSGLAHTGWKPFAESVPQRIERLIAEGKMGKVIVAFPDCFTSLGGNQYINSSVLGNWADFLKDELVQALVAGFRVKQGKQFRALFGKSSGGYGALVHAMLYPESWGAIACHSGDMAFELVYLSDFPDVARHLQRHQNDISLYLQRLWSSTKMAGDDFHVLMMLAMAASYDPAPDQPHGIRLPFDLHTCELDQVMWRRWLRWDPLELVSKLQVQQNLQSLGGVFLDCGNQDQYSLLYGARRLADKLVRLNVEHVYEEFPDNHSGVDYRLDVSLPYLYEKLMQG